MTNRPAVLWLYAGTMLVSATLIFLVQPMIGKLLLPLLGGSPAVWNTCMVFFQVMLLLGYLYAHLLTTKLQPRHQVIAHITLLALAALALPSASRIGAPPTETLPIGWLLMTLAAVIGLPFLTLSASAPLFQAWFARTDHPLADNPYPLYGASNLGSMISLFSYPLIVERALGASQQTTAWSVGYVSFGALVLLCGSVIWKLGATPAVDGAADDAEATPDAAAVEVTDVGTNPPPPGWRQVLSWVALAFVPSSLTLGVTTHLSTDISAIPLLWILPLALYLASFIVAFASRQPVKLNTWRTLMLFSGLLLDMTFSLGTDASVPTAIALHLSIFFIITMVFHGGLVARRPPVQYLTRFYLWMSVGGALGGTFNALVAPLIFHDAYDYIVILLLAYALLFVFWSEDESAVRHWKETREGNEGDYLAWIKATLKAHPREFITGAIISTSFIGVITWVWVALQKSNNVAVDSGQVAWLAVSMIALSPLIYHFRRVTYGVILVIMAVGAHGNFFQDSDTLMHSERSFFGAHQVYKVEEDQVIKLAHGTTLHGAQSYDPKHRDEPLTYYTRQGPLGQAFKHLNANKKIKDVGALGLGSGSVAAYAQPGQKFVFYEIDPVVSKIAQDPKYFTYMKQCGDRCSVILGDGRLMLEKAPDNSYDFLILDAYSSDSIPVHLITREAVQIYMKKLRPGGVLAFHISNRYFELQPVLAKLAADQKLSGAAQLHFPKKDEKKPGHEKYYSTARWVLLSDSKETIDAFLKDERWKALGEPPAQQTLWTDDFSNLFETLSD